MTGMDSHLVATTWPISTLFLDDAAELDGRAWGKVGADAVGVPGSVVEKRPKHSSGQTLRR